MTAPSDPQAPSTPTDASDPRLARARRPYQLGPMPPGRAMITVDESVVAAPIATIFALARDVEDWPRHLPHYRSVRFRARTRDRGGLVEMSANRPFGSLNWPTWWLSEMSVDERLPNVRYRHVQGVTAGMDVEWTFERAAPGDDARTRVRIVHVWDGPSWPVIGPVFVHGIASRTLAGLARVAEAMHAR